MTSTYTEPAAVEAAPGKNVLGIIALITAILGTIFACVPGALILGWVLLPIAFILALVSVFLKGKKRGAGIAALILSVVGTIIGGVVFLTVVGNAFDDAFSDETNVSVGQNDEEPAAEETVPAAETSDEDTAGQDSAGEDATAAEGDGEQGTRANPYPLGAEISTSEWVVTVNSVDLDATAAVLEENPYNDAPEEGHAYILVNLTAQYIGDDAEGETPWVGVEYVSPAGNTFTSADVFAVVPDSFDSLGTLYEGASTSGNIGLHVPAESVEEGTLKVSPSLFGDAVFVAVN